MILRIFLPLIFSLFTQSALASCRFEDTGRFNFPPNIKVSSLTPIGTIIARGSANIMVICNIDNPNLEIMRINLKRLPSQCPNYNGQAICTASIFPEEISTALNKNFSPLARTRYPGVAMRMYIAKQESNFDGPEIFEINQDNSLEVTLEATRTTQVGVWHKDTLNTSTREDGYPTLKFSATVIAELVKVDNISLADTQDFDDDAFMVFMKAGKTDAPYQEYDVSQIYKFHTRILDIAACKIDQKNINVNMGSLPKTRLINGLAPEIYFNITVNCFENSHLNNRDAIFLTFSDQSNPINTTKILGLTPNSEASGIGIEIIKDGQPIDLDLPMMLPGKIQVPGIGNDSGIANMQFTARYVMTGSKDAVSAGSANAAAMITIGYR